MTTIKITDLHRFELREFKDAVKTRIADRQKALWSRIIGAGFIFEDIVNVWPERNMQFFGLQTLSFPQRFSLTDLNLRELDELLKWLEQYVPESYLDSVAEHAANLIDEMRKGTGS